MAVAKDTIDSLVPQMLAATRQYHCSRHPMPFVSTIIALLTRNDFRLFAGTNDFNLNPDQAKVVYGHQSSMRQPATTGNS